MWLNLPGGAQPESCSGMLYNLDLLEPLGARTVLQRNPDGSTTPVQPNPY